MSSFGASKSWALGGGRLNRCGDGYDEEVLAFLFPSTLLVEPFGAISRFLRESFFSRCSRWIGVEPGAGVFEGAREEGLRGDGTAGMWSLRPIGSAMIVVCEELCRWTGFLRRSTRRDEVKLDRWLGVFVFYR